MSAPARTRVTTPAVRRRVLEAALEAFTTHGYDAVSIGMEVEVVFEPADDVWIPLFRPRVNP